MWLLFLRPALILFCTTILHVILPPQMHTYLSPVIVATSLHPLVQSLSSHFHGCHCALQPLVYGVFVLKLEMVKMDVAVIPRCDKDVNNPQRQWPRNLENVCSCGGKGVG